jgi:hypothetical protein
MIEKLREQAHRLEKAVAGFYAGDPSEALTISVIVRVLVHETRQSTPLLKYLTEDYEALQIKDKLPDDADAAEANARRGYLTGFCPLGFAMDSNGVSPAVDLTMPTYELVPLKSWWNRACLVFAYGPVTDFALVKHAIFSKRQLTLTLANKEGGAHVDLDVPQDYIDLVTNSPIEIAVNGRRDTTLNLARAAVAQTGAELLECMRRNFLEPASQKKS